MEVGTRKPRAASDREGEKVLALLGDRDGDGDLVSVPGMGGVEGGEREGEGGGGGN